MAFRKVVGNDIWSIVIAPIAAFWGWRKSRQNVEENEGNQKMSDIKKEPSDENKKDIAIEVNANAHGDTAKIQTNETAEAILIILKRIMKWIGVSALGVGLLGAIVAGGVAGYEYITVTMPKKQIAITVDVSQKICTDDKWPVFVGVVNNSSKTLTNVTVYLNAFVPGHSTNHAGASSKASSDKILKPKEGYGSCWSPGLAYTAPKKRAVNGYDW